MRLLLSFLTYIYKYPQPLLAKTECVKEKQGVVCYAEQVTARVTCAEYYISVCYPYYMYLRAMCAHVSYWNVCVLLQLSIWLF